MNERCFAQLDGCECEATEAVLCMTYDCPFYATREQHEQSVQQAYARLRSLPEDQQGQISKKYYRGEMPWIG